MRRAGLGALLREAFTAARAQPIASAATIVLVAGMCAAVLLTTGRAVGAERDVLSTIDAAGTRSIVVRAGAEAGLDSSVLDRLGGLEGVETAAALGLATDVRNAALPDGAAVPMRDYWSIDGLDAAPEGSVLVSERARDELGMLAASGAVARSDGTTLAVAGSLGETSGLASFEPLILVPRERGDPGPVAAVVIIADRASGVAALSEVVRPLIAAENPGDVSIESSSSLASLRTSVGAQLGAFGSGLSAAVLALTGVLVAAVQTTLVLLRRKDFGRRRALGATRGLIVALVLLQTTALALVGALTGSIASSTALAVTGDPLPGADFLLAVAVLAVATAVVAAIAPAVLASRRDPIKELRVP